MLKSIKIFNFQSHKHTEMKLSAGINALAGNSDCGKSAVLRSMFWGILNTPSGDAYISDWAKTQKGSIKKGATCRVDIETDDGKQVSRVRGDGFNGYLLFLSGSEQSDQSFEALRSDVPEQVTETLRLGTVNIQRQLDGPFLLSSTPGEVARYINTLVNLTKIDDYQSAVASKIRVLGINKKNIEDTVADSKKQVEALSWVDDAEEKVKQVAELEKEFRRLTNLVIDTANQLKSFYAQREDITRMTKILDRVNPVLKELPQMLTRERSIEKAIMELERSSASHREACVIVARYPKTMDSSLELLEGLRQTKDTLCRKVANIEREFQGHSTALHSIPKNLDEIESRLNGLTRIHSIVQKSKETIDKLSAECFDYASYTQLAKDSEIQFNQFRNELKTMVCPVCGHIGCEDL